MPLARYFFFVGGVLLALLLISDAYLPKLPVSDRADSVLPVIRIHSDRKWPERVVYDTNLPTIIPAHIANTDSLPSPAPARVADASTKAREAFARLLPSAANQLQPSDPKKREPTRRRKIARRHAAPPTIRLAQRPQFGFVGGSIW